jgi:benzodiazapine receptor
LSANCAAAGIASFATVNPLAAALFVPTQVWVTIAAALNYAIVRLNRGGGSKAA